MIDWRAGIAIIKVCCFTGLKSDDKNVISIHLTFQLLG